MTPRITSEYSEFRRRQIVAAAWESFAERGYEATTIRDIARTLNLSTGIIYCHFKGKADMLKAVQECGRANTEDMLNAIARDRGTREAVREIVRAVALQAPVADRRKNAKAAIHLWAEAIKNPGFKRLYLKQYGIIERAISRILSDGAKRGELRKDLDPKAFAAFLLAALSGLQVQMALNDIPDPDRFSEDFAAFVLGHLGSDDKT